MVARVGLEHARELWTLSEAGVVYVRNADPETGMPGVEPVAGWLDVSKVDGGDEMLAVVEPARAGVRRRGRRLADRTRARCAQDRPLFPRDPFPDAFHIHPLNYALGLAAAAEAAGVRIFEETPAMSIDPAGVRKRVVTPTARVRAAMWCSPAMSISARCCRRWRKRCCRSRPMWR